MQWPGDSNDGTAGSGAAARRDGWAWQVIRDRGSAPLDAFRFRGRLRNP